jgi:hypothetical protein
VVAPIAVASIVPPVMATALPLWLARLPSPATSLLDNTTLPVRPATDRTSLARPSNFSHTVPLNAA